MPDRGRCPPGASRHCRAVLGVQTCHTAAALLTGCVLIQDSPASLDHPPLWGGRSLVAFQPPPGLAGGLVLVPTQGPFV